MKSSRIKVWSDKYSYFINACPYCSGPHFWQQCQYIPEGELCAPSLSCEFCGGGWNECSVCCYPTPNLANENSNDSCVLYSMDSCRKLLDQFGDLYKSMEHAITHLIEGQVNLLHEVDVFGLDIHNLKDELSAMTNAFDAQKINYKLCEAIKLLLSQ
ncbi:unnamed protein product [Withania somnifera]